MGRFSSDTVRVAQAAVCALLLLAGPAHAREAGDDPWEGWNRRVYAFNETVDKYALKPVAKGYRKVTPGWLDDSVTRFFENLKDVRSALNNVLQWEWRNASSNTGRVLVNTTLGIGGLFDVATRINLKKYPDDLGSTFAVWGMGEGPFLVLPFLGPSTVRDTVAIWPQDYMWPPHYIEHDLTRYSVTAVYVIDLRADLLDIEKNVVGDRYTFIRDFYLQTRRLQAGEEPPPDDFGADSFDDDWGDDEGW